MPHNGGDVEHLLPVKRHHVKLLHGQGLGKWGQGSADGSRLGDQHDDRVDVGLDLVPGTGREGKEEECEGAGEEE